MSKVVPQASNETGGRLAGWRGDVLLAVAAALLAMLFLTLAFNRVWPLTVDVGVRDQRFVSGFYAVQELDGQLSRWTGGDSTLALPRPPLGVPVLAELPVEMDVRVAGDAGTPVVIASPDSAAAQAFMRLARGLVQAGIA